MTIRFGDELRLFAHSDRLKEAYAISLLHLMTAISEERLAASWAPNLEYSLWGRVKESRHDEWTTEQDVTALKFLSDACDGWWVESQVPDVSSDDPITFMSKQEWEEHYQRVWVPLRRGVKRD